MMDLKEAVEQMTRVSLEVPRASNASLEHAAQVVEEEAKRVLGTYDYGWPRLKPSTVARKTTGDSPLLETGEMRESITHWVNVETHTAYVGSNNPKAKWHELGTSRVPPRSFLRGAAMAKQKEVHQIVRDDLGRYLSNPDVAIHTAPYHAAVQRQGAAAVGTSPFSTSKPK